MKDETVLALLNETEIDVLEALANTDPSAKEEFLRDPALSRPRNRYGNLDGGRAEANLAKLDQAAALLEGVSTEETRRLYGAILDQHRRQNRFVLANARYQAAGSAAAESMHRQANLDLYGAPDRAVFRAILGEKLARIRARTLTGEERRRFGELLALLGPAAAEAEGAAPFAPDEAVFRVFSGWMEERFQGFFRHIPPDRERFTAWDVCAIVNEILDQEPEVQGKGWRAVVDADGAYAFSDSRERRLHFPGKRSRGPYDRAAVREIIGHELGVHAMRSMPFADCPVEAMALGLPGYEVFEEGLATAVGSALRGSFRCPGLTHYVSVGLAFFHGYDFRHVFETQVRLEGLAGAAGPSECFDSVQRAFRGTGVLPNNKDLVYLNGSRMAWAFIRDHLGDREGLLRQLFQMGKSDPRDENHRFLCRRLAGDAEKKQEGNRS